MDYVALAKIVVERTQLEIWKRLNTEDRAAFALLREPEEIGNFMAKKVANLESIIELSARATIDKLKAK